MKKIIAKFSHAGYAFRGGSLCLLKSAANYKGDSAACDYDLVKTRPK